MIERFSGEKISPRVTEVSMQSRGTVRELLGLYGARHAEGAWIGQIFSDMMHTRGVFAEPAVIQTAATMTAAAEERQYGRYLET